MQAGRSLDRALARASGAAVALTLSLLFWPAALRRVFVYGDLGNFLLPFRMFLAESIEKGITPLWMPHLFCGFYVHGEGQIGASHPLRWLLYALAPVSEAFNVECIVAYPAALIGVALFLRRQALPASAALFGGTSFALSAWMTVRLTHLNTIAVIAHVGWVLFAIDVVLREPSGRKRVLAWVGIAVLTGSQLLIGSSPALVYCLLLEIPYALFVATGRREARPLLAVSSALVVGFMLGGIQAVPTWGHLTSSLRTDPSFEYLTQQSLHPLNLLLVFAPWLYWFRVLSDDTYNPIEQAFYFGAVVPIAGLWVILRWKQLGPLRSFVSGLLALSVFALLLAFGRHTAFYRVILEIPALGMLRVPARYSVVLFFAGAVLAAIAFADLLRGDAPRDARRRSWCIWIIPAISWLIAWIAIELRDDPAGWGRAATVTKLNAPRLLLLGPLVFTLAGALFFAAARGSRAALFGLVLLSLADNAAYAASLWWIDPPRTLPEYRESIAIPPALPGSRLATEFDIRTYGPRDGPVHYWASTSFTVHGTHLVSGYAAIVPATRLDYSKPASLRVAGASARLVGMRRFTRLPGALPRARMVADAVQSADPSTQIEQIDVATTALVEDAGDLVAGPPGEAVIQQEIPGRIHLATRTPTRQLLVLAESFHEGWRVTVDGHEQPVLRVYGDFMGCVVEAGRHTVRFRFEPRSYEVGRWVSLTGTGLVLAVCLTTWRRHHRSFDRRIKSPKRR